jgi:hypothetical protein
MQRARRSPVPAPPYGTAPAGIDPVDEAALELVEVPAAVVCALCGKPDCPGCLGLEEPTNASGVVAIVPWERPVHGWLTRLWATARLTTLSHREFFSGLPEGGWQSPLAFAVLCEALAALGLSICVGALVALLPDVLRTLLVDAELRAVLLRTLSVGLPGLAVTMVSLHALHGLLIDRAARRLGSKKRGRGLRFGLYACGWDLVTMPFGLLLVLLSEGAGAAKRAATLGLSVPNQAARAYLTGVHALDPERAKRAAKKAVGATGIAAVLLLATFGAVLVLFSIS